MKLVIGQGNPGARYNFTRHNTGFLGLDFYFKVKGLEWEPKMKFGAIWGRARGLAGGEDVIFIKPQEFYNETGRVAQEFVRFYKLAASDILVVCDDFNLEFGTLRYRGAGSAGGNNGLKSLIAALGTEDFARIRVGTGNAELRRKMGDTDFVLSRFTPEEKEKLPEVLRELVRKIDEILEK